MVSGLADPAARRYLQPQPGDPTATVPGGGLPGSSAAFDVGLRPAGDVHALRQPLGRGATVAGARSSETSPASAGSVDFGDLEAGTSDGYAPAAGRFYNRIFRSNQSYGEGISLKNPTGPAPGGSPDPQFRSPYQPYGLYIPADYQPGRRRRF